MTEFDYQLDNNTLEIFPADICANSFIVFHGTVAHHSEKIEANGFQLGTAAYDPQQGLALADLLEQPGFVHLDVPTVYPIIGSVTLAQDIRQYLTNVQSNDWRISFAILSSAGAQFGLNSFKGGQGYVAIRKAKEIVDKAITASNSLSQAIPSEVQQLFAGLADLDASLGVVYAVELPNNLQGVEIGESQSIVWSSASIPVSSVIGKVVVPANTVLPDPKSMKEKGQAKQNRMGGLVSTHIRLTRDDE